MPRFSEYFKLGVSQHELDFVDISNEEDTSVYVDPYAIEIKNDNWSQAASESIRVFFKEVLDSLRDGDLARAEGLMSHLTEPKETFLGVSRGEPKGRGVGRGQARQLITAMRGSKAFQSGLLSDLSEMALYVEGIDRDKISDLTTNIIRDLLVEYTQEQCELYGIDTDDYNGPAFWNCQAQNWESRLVQLPYIQGAPVMLVPKYIVRKNLSLNSQEFYNKQITDFLVAENMKANSSLVQTIKGKRVVYKTAVREENPKSKSMIADMVRAHPDLLDLYKDIASKQGALLTIRDGIPSILSVCSSLSAALLKIDPGRNDADRYHRLVMGVLTTLFYPKLIQPHLEWKINSGRKRIDIVFTNAADTGFFAQRRSDHKVNANSIIVECKNYSKDIANQEIDQLLGRFDENRGRFGILTCRSIDDEKILRERCKDASSRSRGYIIVLTDDDLIYMLRAKAEMRDDEIEGKLHSMYRRLLE